MATTWSMLVLLAMKQRAAEKAASILWIGQLWGQA
jgi:hypothetical protein